MKNNKLINSLKEIASRNRADNIAYASEEILPQLYAAIALALHRKYGFGSQRILTVIAESQSIWEEFTGNGDGMIQLCEDETGVRVVNPRLEEE